LIGQGWRPSEWLDRLELDGRTINRYGSAIFLDPRPSRHCENVDDADVIAAFVVDVRVARGDRAASFAIARVLVAAFEPRGRPAPSRAPPRGISETSDSFSGDSADK
jgi:hypothetical protein